MVHYNATDAKNHFGRLLDDAQRDVVLIEKNGRNVAAVLSNKEYQRLQELEDAIWAIRADMAKQKGFLTEEESEILLNGLLNAKD